MLLYHGSNIAIDNIDLSLCKPYKDFGRGFYLTTIESQAILMARRTSRLFSGMPTVTTFSFEEEALLNNTLSVKIFESPTFDWAIFVLNNRNHNFMDFANENNNHDNKYDIVIGPVANDDISLLLRTYTRGFIDDNALLRDLVYRKVNDQYSFHTSKALSLLNHKEAQVYD